MSDTEWVVFCPAHQHYLVFAGLTGTTWTADQDQARRFTSKREAARKAEAATWLDHDPIPWAVASDTTAYLTEED